IKPVARCAWRAEGFMPAVPASGVCFHAARGYEAPGSMTKTPVSLLQRLREKDDAAAWEDFVALFTPLLYTWSCRMGRQASDPADQRLGGMRFSSSAGPLGELLDGPSFL